QHVGRRMEHADIVHRFVAILIDSILIGIIVGIMYAVVIIGGLMDIGTDPGSLSTGMFTGAIFIVTIISYVIFLLYFVVMEGGPSGATIGKKVMKLKVVDEQYRDIDMGKAFIRNILRWIPYLSYLIFIIDVIMILVRDDNQSLRDIIAHTYVVKVPQYAQQGYMPPPPQAQYQPPPPQQQAPPPQQPPQQGQQQPPQY
ncbi:MAG: RDD family protein, partial [Thermoplasmata archaeon]|nr:RDD family protein [Thermoplasmata archaeon]